MKLRWWAVNYRYWRYDRDGKQFTGERTVTITAPDKYTARKWFLEGMKEIDDTGKIKYNREVIRVTEVDI